MRKFGLIVFSVLIFLICVLYLFKSFNKGLNILPAGTDNVTSLRGGTIHAKIFCIENNNKVPCKGGI